TPPVLVGLGVSATATAASTFSTLGLGALAPTLRASLHLTTAEVGLIAGLVSLGALTASVPAGHVTDRIGAGRSLTLALLGVTAGVVIAVLAPGRWVFLGGAFVAGLGYGAVNPATNVLSTALVPRRRRALFLSVKQTGVTLGGLAAGLALPRLAQWLGWRSALTLAIAVLLGGVVMGLWAARREAAGWFDSTRGVPAGRSASTSLSLPRIAPTALFGFVMSGVQFSLAAYLTVYLVDTHGFSKTTAGTALSVAFASACVGRIAWGWLSDRWFTSHATTLAVIAGASAATIAAMASGISGPSLWLIMVMIGLSSIAWNGVYMALITEPAARDGLGRATGRGLTAIYAGSALVPPLLGAVKDVSDSWPVAWGVAVGAVLLAGAILAGTSRRLVAVA
ncbi:MAG TPA: MFS transporter, partial [Solirubrobacteraceae bacterium]|nr:MFS transporter [Solirubrobacteraceae bacterium]